MTALGVASGLALTIYLLIMLVDPYDSIPFSPNWDRYPVRGDHRHWNALLLRKPAFDSAVIGTSTSMLLRPAELNAALGGRFANLAMPAATPFEQLRILELFQHHHRGSIGTVIVGIDSLWCRPDGGRRFTNDILRRAFPDWLYDTVAWNDFPPFNKTTLKAAYDQVRAMLGLSRPYPRWVDGYDDITAELRKRNDREAIRKRIHEGQRDGRLWRKPGHTSPPNFPDLDALAAALGRLPPLSRKILMFPPFHHVHQPAPGSEQEWLWQSCKRKAANLAQQTAELVVVDFLRRSTITTEDRNYVDGYHYLPAIASELTRALREAVVGRIDRGDLYQVLGRSSNAMHHRSDGAADGVASVPN